MGFKGKVKNIHIIISASEENKLSTYEIYQKYNSKYSKRGVTMQELSNLLGKNRKHFLKLDEWVKPNEWNSRKIAIWSAKNE